MVAALSFDDATLGRSGVPDGNRAGDDGYHRAGSGCGTREAARLARSFAVPATCAGMRSIDGEYAFDAVSFSEGAAEVGFFGRHSGRVRDGGGDSHAFDQ